MTADRTSTVLDLIDPALDDWTSGVDIPRIMIL